MATVTEERRHTAGPWTVDRSKMATDGAFDYAISADGAPVIAEAFGRDAKGGWPVAEANARLIAAAPELLEALEVFAAAADAYEGPDRFLDDDTVATLGFKKITAGDLRKARAAIKKAKGQ